MNVTKEEDVELNEYINEEFNRQKSGLELIASENFTSKGVMNILGSVLTNKYSEGLPGKRYYGGNIVIDKIESLCQKRALEAFNLSENEWGVNVQPYSGSIANLIAYNALLEPNDRIMGLDLPSGGHLTHGAKPNFSGKLYNAVQYGLNSDSGLIDYDQIEDLAKKHRPRMLIAGFSAYSGILNWENFRTIADLIGAYLLVDMAHVSGLIAAGVYPNPLPHAHVVTSTTHKTLRGPRGGIILTDHEDIAKKCNSAIFPGIQGGPLCHVIAAKAVAFKEAASGEFVTYQKQVVKNAKVMAETFLDRGVDVVSGGTENHLMLVSLIGKKFTGKDADEALGLANITVNKNAVPNDPRSPFVTSGLRLGTPAITTRGFGEKEFKLIAELIHKVIKGLSENKLDNSKIEKEVKKEIIDLCAAFPIYDV